MNQPFEDIVEQYRQRAFAVAESVSPAYLAQLSALVQNAIETGATLEEFRAAVRDLDNTQQSKDNDAPPHEPDWGKIREIFIGL